MFAPGSSIQPVANRKWWPDAYLDEIMPAGRAMPDLWLFHLNDGAHHCGCKPGVNTYEDEFSPFSITDGDIVEFSFCDDLPNAVITLGANPDSFTFEPPAPERCTLWCPDSDDIADSPKELAGFLRENGAEVGGPIEVRVSVWGAGASVRLRFTALDGPPRFVVAEATEAARG